MEDYCDVVEFVTVGKGGEGAVYGGTYRGSPVAIKRYNNTHHDELVAKKEVSVMMLAQKEFHMVSFIGYAYEADKICVVMDFAYNYSLSTLLSAAGRHLSLALKQLLVYDMCCSLKCLHDLQISHEDLKPDNIILDFGLRAKLCDFGHCRHTDDDYDLSSGTECYRSPEKERFVKQGTVDKYDRLKSDIYSVGLIIQEIYGDDRYHDVGTACKSDDPTQRPTCDDLISAFKPSRLEYVDFRGVEKYVLSEVDRINIAYNWSYDMYEDILIDECRVLIVSCKYEEAYNLLLVMEKGYIRSFFMGILLFHGLGCQKDTNESLSYMSHCKTLLEEDEIENDQMRYLVEYYVAILDSNVDSMLMKLLSLSDKGNSFAQVELIDLYNNQDFMMKHSVTLTVADKFVIGGSKSGHSHAQALSGIFGFSFDKNACTKFTGESVRYMRRSAEGGSVLAQLLLDVANNSVDFSAVRNPYAADLVGDIYLLMGQYDWAELWYHRACSYSGLALLYRKREAKLGVLYLQTMLDMQNRGRTNMFNPADIGFCLKMNKPLMLQAPYCIAFALILEGQFDRARAHVMACTDESIYSLDALDMVFRGWMETTKDYSLIEEKRSSMSSEGVALFGRHLMERNQEDLAFRWFQEAAKRGNGDSMHGLARYYFERGDMEKAEYWATSGVSTGNQLSKVVRARIALLKGHRQSAIEMLEECSHSGDSEALFLLGMLHEGDLREKYLLRSSVVGFHMAPLELSRHYKSLKNTYKAAYWYTIYFYYHVKPLELEFNVHVPYSDVMYVLDDMATNTEGLEAEDAELVHNCISEKKKLVKNYYRWLSTDGGDKSMLVLLARRKLIEENRWLSGASTSVS